jgi:hypothetical protein
MLLVALPSPLLRALDQGNPEALADTTLPRLASLVDGQRLAFAERIAD